VAAGDGSGFTAPPSVPAVIAPGAPSLTTALTFSAVTPPARVDASWADASAYDGEVYSVAISTDSTFAVGTEISTTATNQTTISIDNRAVGTLYYVRLRTVIGGQGSDWGPSASITTPLDTTPPAAVTSHAASFAGVGDLVVTWVNPTSANFKDVEIKIYASNGGTLLATLYNATQQQVWTAAQNLAATSGAGDPSLYIELRSRSWGAVLSSAVNVSATKSAPAAPTISVDFTGADAVYTLTLPTDALYISFVADTSITARRLALISRYTYTFDTNRVDHAGTADPSLAFSFTAVDGLNQASSATSGTATNFAPSAPTVVLTGAFSQLVCRITSTRAIDFSAYEYVWKRDGGTVRTLESASSEQQLETGAAGDEGSHSWTCTVREKDVFSQYSGTTVSSAVVLDTLTIAYLRSGAYYSDDAGGTFFYPNTGTLAGLKDGIVATGGLNYAA
jgi:hypothetical protein